MRTTRQISIAAFLLTGLPVALGAQGAAGSAGPPPEALPGVFGEVLDVRVVNLEVVVTDASGQRVYDLRPTDFRLEVDGQPINVEYFTEVRGGTAVEVSAEAPVPGVPALAGGEPVGTSYLLFIDEMFAIGRDRDRALEALRDQLPRIGPEDRMAVVAFDGKRLEMLSSWTSSVPELERVLTRAQGRRAHGLERLAERRSSDLDKRNFSRSRLSARGAFLETRLTIDERMYAGQLAAQVERAVTAATATLRSFAAPPGRKVMLLLSGGWPYSPAQYAVDDLRRPIIDDEVPGGPDLYRPMVDTANLLGYTIYGVDVPGLDTELVDASEGAPADFDSGAGSVLGRESNVHQALRYVARETGGEALINARGRKSLEIAAEDTRSYYWLGFRPQRKGDDQRHEVKLSMTRPGLRARLRGDFLDFSRQREVTMAVESSLLFGNASTQSGLVASLGVASKAGVGKVEVPLQLEVPAGALTFLPTASGYSAQLELRVAAMDDVGNRAEIPVIPLTLRQEQPAAAEQVLRFGTRIALRKRPHQLVVALYDVAADQILATDLTFAP